MIQNSKNIRKFTVKGLLHTSIPCLPGSRTSPASIWAAILFLYDLQENANIYISFLPPPLVLHKMCQLYTLVYLSLNYLITVLELFPV